MADGQPAASRNRRYGEKPMARKFLVFVGDCSLFGQVLASKPITPLWVIIGFLDSLLRTYGQVVFCNNPVTGMLVMSALFFASSFAALVGLVAATVAIFTAWLVDQPGEAVRAGVFSYNALLVGQLTPVLLGELFVIDWIFVVVSAMLSVYFTSALGALFGSLSKHPLPALTAPFVLAQLLLHLCATAPAVQHLRQSAPAPADASLQLPAGIAAVESTRVDFAAPLANGSDVIPFTATAASLVATTSAQEQPAAAMTVASNDSAANTTFQLPSNSSSDLDWGKVFTGVLQSLAQVYGQGDLVASLLMYLGVIICSPTTALMGFMGSMVNTLVGALLSGDAGAVHAGLWGYNGLLSAACVGGFALVLTPQSAALAMAAALLTGALQHALLPSFQRVGVPILTLPFNLATLLLLCVTAKGAGSLVRPAALTYPEKHRRDWTSQREDDRLHTRTKNMLSVSEIIQEDENEKKEHFRKLEMV